MRCHGCSKVVLLEDLYIRPLYAILLAVRTYKKNARLHSLTKEDLLSGTELCFECCMFRCSMGQSWSLYTDVLQTLRTVQGYGISNANGNHSLADRDASRLVG